MRRRFPYRSPRARPAARPRAAAGTRQHRPLLDITEMIARRLDFSAVAQRIVDAVVTVTDFRVATLTVREGNRCRRLATAGLADGRIGMTTPYDQWAELLVDDWRRGELSYLIPPEAPAKWADIPDLPPSDDPDAWTADHGLLVTLLDHADDIIGFVAVDEPRSGRLPDDDTIATLEVFARQAQVAFANAALYAQARRQADTMARLVDVAKTMAETTDFALVAPRILEAVCQRLPVLSATIAELHPDGTATLWQRTPGHPTPSTRRHVSLPAQYAPLADEVRRRGCVVVGDLADRPDVAAVLDPQAQSFLAVARREHDALHVALTVVSDQVGAFGPDDQMFVSGLLDLTILAMRNAELYDEARRAAERDDLTGLRNRRVFWEALAAELASATTAAPLSLAVVDVDDFKQVNDRFGHDTGDDALVHVAGRLESSVRETDLVFRIGGEEFVLLMPGTGPDEACEVLQRVAGAVKRSRLPLPPLTISAGIAVAPADATTGDGLFSAADTALYRAKAAGKDQVKLASRPSYTAG